MPRSIEEGFEGFLAKLKATAPESDAAKRHRASIEACLKSNFGLKRFVRIGSFGNGTLDKVPSRVTKAHVSCGVLRGVFGQPESRVP